MPQETVYFREEEIEYVQAQEGSFSGYVRELIQEQMETDE